MNMSSYIYNTLNTSQSNQIIYLSQLLKVVAEESRLKLLCLLEEKERCVCEIIPCFDMSQSLISHHLADLKTTALIKDRKEGRKVFYSLTIEGRKITNLLLSLSKEIL